MQLWPNNQLPGRLFLLAAGVGRKLGLGLLHLSAVEGLCTDEYSYWKMRELGFLRPLGMGFGPTKAHLVLRTA